MKKHQVTIKDIAKVLGVSVSTVSRALQGNPKISDATREKVISLAKELKYAPNKIALSLKNQKTKTIGVIIPDIIHHFFASVISGVEDVAYSNGYTVMFCQSNESYEKEALDTMALLSNSVDGLLVSHSRETTNFSHFEEVISRNIPIVFFDRVTADVPAPKVTIDDFSAAKEATQHLIDQSCKSIVHLAGSLNLQICQRRKLGFIAALKENNMPFSEDLIIDCFKGNQEMGYQSMVKLLQSGVQPDGVFANNDHVAYGAMEAIKEAGLHIPNDIAVIGFGNWNFSSLIDPQLSSVDQQGVEMGRIAMRTLLNQVEDVQDENAKDISIIIPSSFIARGSSIKLAHRSVMIED